MRTIKISVEFKPSKADFVFGNCAMLAICGAFNLNLDALRIICSFYKIYPDKGINFWECKKIINRIANYSLAFKHVEYIPNKANIMYIQLVSLSKKDCYLVMFNEHLSYLEKGIIYDSHLDNNTEKVKKSWLEARPTGWWRIQASNKSTNVSTNLTYISR